MYFARQIRALLAIPVILLSFEMLAVREAQPNDLVRNAGCSCACLSEPKATYYEAFRFWMPRGSSADYATF